MIFEAAVKDYNDAGVDPRRDVHSFVYSSEDFLEGTSIFDEYFRDQLGGSQACVYDLSRWHVQLGNGRTAITSGGVGRGRKILR